MAYNDDMTNIYQFKHRLFPAILPFAVPAVMVPLSLASAWTIHACQAARMNLHYYRKRGPTPTELPRGAGGPLRTQDEAVSKLNLAAFKPLPLDGYTSTGLRGLADIAPMYFDSGRILRGRLHRYPHHFHETLIPVTGGTAISGIMGLHHGKLPRPGLVIVHGMLNSKRQDLVRVLTMRAFYEWGFNVIAIDLRGFGRSAESVSVPSGAGSIEAQDVIDVVKYLKKFQHFTSVGVIGFSLGGGTALHVGAHKDAPGLIDGGIMAVSPPINFEAAIKRVDEPPEDHEYLMVFHFFKYLLNRSLTHAEIMKWARKRLEKEGGNPNIGGFQDYLRNLVAWGYLGHGRKKQRDPDVLLDILLRMASPSRVLSRIQVPTFILQSKDDPMIRITDDEIALLERVSSHSEFVRYHITERGGHTAYVAVDPGWFYGVVRSYFTYWGRWATVKRHPFHTGLNVNLTANLGIEVQEVQQEIPTITAAAAMAATWQQVHR